jgi:hypothetical protein
MPRVCIAQWVGLGRIEHGTRLCMEESSPQPLVPDLTQARSKCYAGGKESLFCCLDVVKKKNI